MPLLYSLGQHAALEAMQASEKLFAHLDDVWLVSQPERVGQVHNDVAEHELWTHQDPSAQREDSLEMQRAAEAADPNASDRTGHQNIGVPSGT